MRAVYDLYHYQPTFCTALFLMAAEHERIKRGDEYIDVELWPSTRQHKAWPTTQEETLACTSSIFKPMVRMLPSVRGFYFDRRALVTEEPWHLDGKFAGTPFIEAYAAGIRPLRVSWKIPLLVPYITITLRECGPDYWPTRDSNVEEWRLAALELMRKYAVVVVRDTRKADESLEGCATWPTASRVLTARAGLYQHAAVNLFVNNGPAWFSLALDAPTIIFKPTCETAGKSARAESMERYGVIQGEQLPGAPPHQRLCWGEEWAEVIVQETVRFLESRRD